MSKSTHFFGQPVYGRLTKCLDKDKIIGTSRKHGGERYVKSFDGRHHLLTMLYAVIMRFDSLREIEASMPADVDFGQTPFAEEARIPESSFPDDPHLPGSAPLEDDVTPLLACMIALSAIYLLRRKINIPHRPEPPQLIVPIRPVMGRCRSRCPRDGRGAGWKICAGRTTPIL